MSTNGVSVSHMRSRFLIDRLLLLLLLLLLLFFIIIIINIFIIIIILILLVTVFDTGITHNKIC